MTLDLALWCRYCRTHPGTEVAIPAEELLELIDRLKEAERQGDEAQREPHHGGSGERGGE